MNRCATRCMLAVLVLTLPTVTAMAEDADANSLLGKPTKIMTEKVPSDNDVIQITRDRRSVRISPDGRWLAYFKPAAPLGQAKGEDYAEHIRNQMLQPGILALRDLKTGREHNMLGKRIKRGDTVTLQLVNCFAHSGDRAFLTILDMSPGDEDSPLKPTGTTGFRVRLGKQPKAEPVEISQVIAFAIPLADANTALIGGTDNPEPGPGTMPALLFLRYTKTGTESRPLNRMGVPMAAHPSKSIAAVCLPRRPVGPEPDYSNDQAWKPAKLLLIDPNSGNTLQQPNLHRNQYMCRQAFFTAKGRHLVYDDMDEIRSGDEDGDVPMNSEVPAVRVWDLEKADIVREFKKAMPVGTGPTANTLVIALRDTHFDPTADRMIRKHKSYLADIKTGKTWPITDKTIVPITARGGKLVYTAEKDGKVITYVADIKLPAELQKRQKDSGK